MAGGAFAVGGTLSMLGVAIFAALLAVQELVNAWLERPHVSEEAGCLVGFVPIALKIGGAVVVYRMGSSNYDHPEAITRAAFVLAAQVASLVAAVVWFRFVQRSEWLDDPSPYRSGWSARFDTPGYIVEATLVSLALVISIVGVLSTLSGASGADALATCFVAVVMVLSVGALLFS